MKKYVHLCSVFHSGTEYRIIPSTMKENYMEIERLKAIVLYILNKVPGKSLDKHGLFKILYFASQKRLVKYGRAMISDFYAFEYGPVPSALFSFINGINNPVALSISIDETSYILSPKEIPDMDELSAADIECLDESIKENCGLPFHKLTEKSHDAAWKKAWEKRTGNRGGKMDIIEIARVVCSDEGTIEYISEVHDLELALQ